MPYTKDWRAYPPAFVQLIEAAALRRVEIPCEDAKKAKSLEAKLHAFFGVLHRSAARDPAVLPLDNLSRRVMIKAKGNILVAIPRDQEPDNLLILSALAGANGTTSGDLAGVEVSPEMKELFAKSLTNANIDI